ncbi:hypothetical protein HDK77DRAFT_103647 [Phyllosticta capitalensis]
METRCVHATVSLAVVAPEGERTGVSGKRSRPQQLIDSPVVCRKCRHGKASQPPTPPPQQTKPTHSPFQIPSAQSSQTTQAYCRVSLSTAPPIPAGPPLRRASYLEWRDRGTSTSTSTATPPVPAPPNVRLSSPFASERRTGSVENRLLALPCCALLCGGSMVVSEKGLWIWAIVVTKTSMARGATRSQAHDTTRHDVRHSTRASAC